MKKTLSLLLAVALTISCLAGFCLETAAATEQRLNLHTRYGYSFPAPQNLSGDSLGSLLTDGSKGAFATVTVKNLTQGVKDWYDKDHTLNMFLEGKAPHFYVQNDFGFVADVTRVTADFSTKDGAVLPKSADVFITNDGYNYVQYPTQSVKKSGSSLEIRFAKAVKAKGVKVLFYTDVNKKVSIGELSVYGTPNKNQRLLLSKGAKYRWDGAAVSGYAADKEGTLLTDGSVAAPGDKAHMVARGLYGNSKDPISNSDATVIDMDLRVVRNISDVGFLAYTTVNPDYITVKYSADGKTFYDLGQSYRMGQFGSGRSAVTEYRVTRNHTVKARYLKISVCGKAILSEIEVYGSQNPMAEMNYGFTEKNAISEYSNIAPAAKAKVNNIANSRVNDENYLNYETVSRGRKTTITLDFSSGKSVNGLLIYCLDNGQIKLPKHVKTYLSTNGSSFTEVKNPITLHKMASRGIYRQYFGAKTVKKVKFEIEAQSSSNAGVLEVCAYSGQPQLPIYRGGFFQINCLDYNHEHAVIKNSEYMWHMQLKQMKELGMDYVVIIAGAEYTNKRMNIPSPRLKKKGYKMTTGLGCADPYRAILESAQKLGMKVYIGTVITYGSKPAIMEHGGLAHAQKVLADDYDLIRDIHDLYGKYRSFAGYYFPNEACDQWLHEAGGLELYRTLYQTQSEWIRKIDPGKQIIIAPAVWRAGDPVKSGNLIYDLVKPAGGSKPIVDIVAPQDCLGRETTLEVQPYTYNVFEQHLQEWAKGARRAGCDFWADAEVFEATYQPKRYMDDIHGLELESKLTNCIINFDTPHYFSELAQGSLNNWWRFDMSATLSAYAKRYCTQYQALDQVGRSPHAVPAYSMKLAGYALGFDPFPADPETSFDPDAPFEPGNNGGGNIEIGGSEGSHTSHGAANNNGGDPGSSGDDPEQGGSTEAGGEQNGQEDQTPDGGTEAGGEGISTGTAIGIAVCVVLVVTFAILAALLVVQRRRKQAAAPKKQEEAAEEPRTEADETASDHPDND